MSYQSIDSDDFAIYSTGSCSPGADSFVQLNSSAEFVLNDDTVDQRNLSSSAVNDGSVGRADISKGDCKKGESIERPLDGVNWTINDFISSPGSTSIRKSSVSSGVSSPVAVTWGTIGTNPTSINWNTPGTSRSQNVTFTLDDDSVFLQQNQEQCTFSDAYDKVSFDRPQSNSSQLLTQALSRDQPDVSHLTPLPHLPDVGGLQNINNQCYQAAISEHFKHKKHSKLSQYISKLKAAKPHSGNSQVYDRHQRNSPVQSPTHSYKGTSHGDSPLASPLHVNESVLGNTSMTKTTFSTFTMPSVPSPTALHQSLHQSGPHSPGHSDGPLSPTFKSPDLKKYRYNQTALALQQSGLMKTTIKTAELLRKSRLLQQELTKLRRETTVFVTAVLNNPENKHLKEMYMSKQKEKPALQ